MKILFIDDEENVLNSIKRSLNKWFKSENITPIMTTSAHEALNFIKKEGKEISVIISDQKMPDIQGNELLNLVKKKYPDIVSIILSGHSETKDLENIIKTDIFTYLSKPWSTEDLKSEILKAIGLYKIKTENKLLKSRIDKELKLAGEFQNAIMSNTLNQPIPFPINVTYKPSPSSGVSGDYYEIFKISDDEFVILLGDVSGHGIKPAFITMALKSTINYEYFKNSNTNNFQPMVFTSWLNKRLHEYLKIFPDLFLTLTCIHIDIKNNKCTLTNAGQPDPMLISNGVIKEIINKNIVLGVDSEYKFNQTSFQVEENSKLFICSDGIHPTGNESETYTKNDFKNILVEFKDRLWDHDSILNRIQNDYTKQPWDDDLTLINISFKKENICVE